MTITATDFKARYAELLDSMEEQGEPITIVRRGKPVAVLSPARKMTVRSPANSWKTRGKSLGDIVNPLPNSKWGILGED